MKPLRQNLEEHFKSFMDIPPCQPNQWCRALPRLGAWLAVTHPVIHSLPQRWFADDIIITSSALVSAF